jgi:hypothetical protein
MLRGASSWRLLGNELPLESHTMSIEPVTRRNTSLLNIWARWFDPRRVGPSEPEQVTPPQPVTKTPSPPMGLAARPGRHASPMLLREMAPRNPAPQAAAFKGDELMTKALSKHRSKPVHEIAQVKRHAKERPLQRRKKK